MTFVRESVEINGKPFTIETGRLAKFAHGSVVVTYGESVVLVTAVSGEVRPGLDFFPLTCEYIEKAAAAGKFPGGFFKREGRQRDEEILVSRLIDRPCRPLFPEGYRNDTQVIATVLSLDRDNPTDVLSVTGAAAALHISNIPWNGPLCGIRVARVEGKWIAFPTFEEQVKADINLVVAVSRNAIVMVEGEANEATEEDIVAALEFARQASEPVLHLIDRIRQLTGKEKQPFEPVSLEEKIAERVREICDPPLKEATLIKEKEKRYEAYKGIKEKLCAALTSELGEEAFSDLEKLIREEFEARKYHLVRDYILTQHTRIDGRKAKEIRPIATEVGLLPRAHGSALFQRGETQAMVTTTLGTSSDEQKIDALTGERWKRFLVHYNFPPFATGEVKPLRGPNRREIGHGALAERALAHVIPSQEHFPYTIRVVSETLESNGSSSMAAVCGGTLSLMDAGVPIKAPVAGIAMGLITDGKQAFVLSDILGDEDHLGDMDFKVCGTAQGITAIQMDIKVSGLKSEVLMEALAQAREGRLFILNKMLETLNSPRNELSKHAPRITTIKINPDQIRLVIGPGGKTIKGIIDQTGVAIDVEDNGIVHVASSDSEAVQKALGIIKRITAEPEVGAIYKGIVQRITTFGAFVELLPGIDGLLHISEIAHHRVERVEDVLKEGDSIEIKVIEISRDGKIRLTRRELLPSPDGEKGEWTRERMMAAREVGTSGCGGDYPRGSSRLGDRPRRDSPRSSSRRG
ncbi:polyribonucleotide nucleotidyltransferase [Pajaroellobacter abortibovis]|uniref:Polyribonucleotide nucleotidyltransferase n=1 Tax=Pajaroellobacter abortibovis TaxID=1882918 RepID=A0A1L6MXL9_9BACT|nr:polyribonucleotide nucleotidyltransferase [Pajaroellobacter abortibovis]APS00195.1 polyribonucleotide nucleotidyltransferase [Pajaroellobacter abortibovis]